MKILDIIATVLLIVGGLNWGLVGLFNFNLVTAIFGDGSLLSRLVFIIVGLAAIYQVAMVKGIWRRWHIQHHQAAHTRK